jgi:hypothetical protein
MIPLLASVVLEHRSPTYAAEIALLVLPHRDEDGQSDRTRKYVCPKGQTTFCRCPDDYANTVDGGLVMAMTPPHMH